LSISPAFRGPPAFRERPRFCCGTSHGHSAICALNARCSARRAATSDEVKDLRRETTALKEVVAELTLENRLLKKSVTADGEDAT
jgi:hypothetical protein